MVILFVASSLCVDDAIGRNSALACREASAERLVHGTAAHSQFGPSRYNLPILVSTKAVIFSDDCQNPGKKKEMIKNKRIQSPPRNRFLIVRRENYHFLYYFLTFLLNITENKLTRR